MAITAVTPSMRRKGTGRARGSSHHHWVAHKKRMVAFALRAAPSQMGCAPATSTSSPRMSTSRKQSASRRLAVTQAVAHRSRSGRIGPISHRAEARGASAEETDHLPHRGQCAGARARPAVPGQPLAGEIHQLPGMEIEHDRGPQSN